MKKMVFGSKNKKILLEGECIVNFRTIVDDSKVILEYETESRDFDTEYKIKLKETYTKNKLRNKYYLQLRRIK